MRQRDVGVRKWLLVSKPQASVLDPEGILSEQSLANPSRTRQMSLAGCVILDPDDPPVRIVWEEGVVGTGGAHHFAWSPSRCFYRL
jgi:hypothetical protein